MERKSEINFESRAVLIFLLITFGLSWAIALGIYLGGGLRSMAALALYPYMLMPATSAFIVGRFITGEGFKHAGLRWGNGGRYYLIAWLIPVGIVAAAYMLTVALGLGRLGFNYVLFPKEALERMGLTPSFLVLMAFLINLGPALIVGLIPTFGEEFGWRAYLLPKLLSLGRDRALILHGIIWGVWHAPIIAMGHNYPGYPIIGILMMTLFTTLLGIVFGWLYFASGSVFTCALAHAALNNAASAFMLIVSGFNPLIGGAAGVICFVVMGVVVAFLYKRGEMKKVSLDNLP